MPEATRKEEPPLAKPLTASRLATYERRYRDLLGELSALGFVSAGSVALRYNRCGKPSCACHADPPRPHGPYWQWTAKVNGKTVNRRLNEREAQLYQEWIDNDRRLRRVVDDLHRVAAKATRLILNDANQTTTKV